MKIAILNVLFSPAVLREATGILERSSVGSPVPALTFTASENSWRKWRRREAGRKKNMEYQGVRGWGWGRRKGRKGLLSHPGCICSRGRWAGGTIEGEARTLGINRREELKRWNRNYTRPLSIFRRYLWWTISPSDDIKSSNRSPLISVWKQWRGQMFIFYLQHKYIINKAPAWSWEGLPFVGSNMSESSFGKSNTGKKSRAILIRISS